MCTAKTTSAAAAGTGRQARAGAPPPPERYGRKGGEGGREERRGRTRSDFKLKLQVKAFRGQLLSSPPLQCSRTHARPAGCFVDFLVYESLGNFFLHCFIFQPSRRELHQASTESALTRTEFQPDLLKKSLNFAGNSGVFQSSLSFPPL